MLVGLVLIIHSQKRLERIERLKDDPYYIFDKKKLEKPIAFTSSDIDSIPVVRLDDLMPVAPGAPFFIHADVVTLLTHTHISSLGTAPTLPETLLREDFQSSPHQKQEFVVDREGEMPMFVKPSLLDPNEFRQSMSSTPISVSSIPIYDAGDPDIPRSRSLDPIKVTRPKKKGTAGKKKRTSKPEVAAG